jgi:hypothetical protein
MRRLPAILAFTILAALLLACSGNVSFTNGPTATGPGGPSGPVNPLGPVDPGPPVVISAQKLGQEFDDDPNGTMTRYLRKLLQVDGVIAERDLPGAGLPDTGVNNPVGAIVFKVPVTDRRNGAKKEYELHCFFKDPIPANDPQNAKLAVGKTVTIKGQISGVNIGSPSASLGQCTLVEP